MADIGDIRQIEQPPIAKFQGYFGIIFSTGIPPFQNVTLSL
jgi:hypothetical protein